ncbi:MAG: serine hydrolase [Cyanobacteriota bacterium]|nr:serine hydrolase [Cyanobacteriota bacterium]
MGKHFPPHLWTLVFSSLSLLLPACLAQDASLSKVLPTQAEPLSLSASAQSTTISSTRLRQAARYSARKGGLSMVVWQGNRILFEQYERGFSADSAHPIYSGTKSFVGVLAIAASMDGLLSFEELVSDTIQEWQADPQRSEVTIRQLLQLISGVDSGELGQPPTYAEAIAYPSLAQAGTTFDYGPVPFQVFGELMRRKLLAEGKDLPTYLQQRIFDPLGITWADWEVGEDGYWNVSSGAVMQPQAWGTFGLLLLGQGEWQGETILDAQLLASSWQGTDPNPGYGTTFWLNAPGILPDDQPGNPIGAGPSDTVMAAGAAGQRLYVIPSQDVVIVRQGLALRGEFVDADFLRILFP